MNKHTPGPWTYTGALSASENHRGYYIDARDRGTVCVAHVTPLDRDGAKGAANARLIAAAPDLLMLAHFVAEFFSNKDSQIGAMARAVITKAEGRA